MAPLNFDIIRKNGKNCIKTNLKGKPLLTTPQLNKGSAFNLEERKTFGLLGKLPPHVETLEQQTKRAYLQFQSADNDFQRHIFLNRLHDTNHVLFYNLVLEHLEEMMPLIYTPHVGTVVKQFSEQFRQSRGLYITYPDINEIDVILENRSNPNIKLIVVTDGEAVLGIGDQGVGAINIPIAKLMVYTLCAGIDPTTTLPIMLDVGTNNEKLLNDPLYLGWKHKRIEQDKYQKFIKTFIAHINNKFPNALLHWEDCGLINARKNLAYCKNKVCSFNDDIQGTGAVSMATILAGLKSKNEKLTEQRIIIFGAGTAGTGIADQLYNGLRRYGLNEQQAKKCFWLIDRPGLLTDDLPHLTDHQQFYARPANECATWTRNPENKIGLFEVIHNIKPTILIGCSSVAGAFTEKCINEMAKYVQIPIIMPLSNPTQNAEATPADIIKWTAGQALIATGSPFQPVTYNERIYQIAQCNNSFIFPGLGLGLIAAKVNNMSADMLWAATEALSESAPILHDPSAPLLPSLQNSREFARCIAISIIEQAVKEGVTKITPNDDFGKIVDELMWYPHYYELINNED